MPENGLVTEVAGDDVVVRYADPGHAAYRRRACGPTSGWATPR